MNSLILAIFTLLMSLPPSRHDTESRDVRAGRMWVTAHAIAAVSESDRDAAMLITQGWFESKFDAAVGSTQCRPGTCDWHEKEGFRARGFWQVHRNAKNGEQWQAITQWSNDALMASVTAAHWSLRRCRKPSEAFQAQDGDGCRTGPIGNVRYPRMLQAENALRVVRGGGEVPREIARWQ
jgi:hypothetical protein